MLRVTIDNSRGVAVLRCSGRIGAGEGPWTLLSNVISLKDKRVVVLDLMNVSRTDARGLGVLVFLSQWATGAGVTRTDPLEAGGGTARPDGVALPV